MTELIQKIKNTIYAHPNTLSLAVGLGIALAITAVLAGSGVEQAFAEREDGSSSEQ